MEKPVRIIDTKEQELRNRTIHWVKVLWENHEPEEATWELWDQVKKKYPHLLPEVSVHLEDQMLQGAEDFRPRSRFILVNHGFSFVYLVNGIRGRLT